MSRFLYKNMQDVGPYSINGRGNTQCVVASIYADGPPSELIATIGICAYPESGSDIWRAMHMPGVFPVMTDPNQCPNEPWVAVILHAGFFSRFIDLDWLGDFERCLGWAWLTSISLDA